MQEESASEASGAAPTNQPLLPAGLTKPKPLKVEGNLATN